MSASTPAAEPLSRPQKLAIVHLLGWTLGVAVVLGIYRAAIVWHTTDEGAPQLGWFELGYGLAYGTAASGLGLYLWRRWKGGAGPSQPGHWILVFAGVALVIDVGVAVAIEVAIAIAGSESNTLRNVSWMLHQAVGWTLASLIGVAVLFNTRGATRHWAIAAFAVVMMLALNALAHSALLATYSGPLGNSVWRIASMIRPGGAGLTLMILWSAVIIDFRLGIRRDWLHAGGIAAVSGLGLVDIASQLRQFLG